jgi:prepilin-type N-terminal cleavage/methylation domain-containing protein
MLNNLQKRKEGFTIIEVMIVLAIAGLIMLIVFLAVPALQRNSRNQQRSSDASRIAAAIGECASNNNGNPANCITAAQLGEYITLANNQQLTSIGGPSNTQFALGTSLRCNPTNTGTVAAPAREFAVTYRQETQSNTGGGAVRCVSS